jgi:hypothetical protein
VPAFAGSQVSRMALYNPVGFGDLNLFPFPMGCTHGYSWFDLPKKSGQAFQDHIFEKIKLWSSNIFFPQTTKLVKP